VSHYHKRNPVFSVDWLSKPVPLMQDLLRRTPPTRPARYLKFLLHFVWIMFSILFDFVNFVFNAFFQFCLIFFQFCLNFVLNVILNFIFKFIWILFSISFLISFVKISFDFFQFRLNFILNVIFKFIWITIVAFNVVWWILFSIWSLYYVTRRTKN
jgi:hypothetical protein